MQKSDKSLEAGNIEPLTIILAESHNLVRRALADRLQASPLVDSVIHYPSLTPDGENFIALEPDLILLGLPQPLIRDSKIIYDQARQWVDAGITVIVLSSYFDAQEQENLLAVGVRAYYLKQINTPGLIDEIMDSLFT